MRKDLARELKTARNVSVEIKSVTGESLTIPAGAAGTVVVAQLANFPVRNSAGNDIGGYGDTSLVLTSSTAFVTEVVAGTADSALTDGQYWVDYVRGEIRGKKASTSTSATADYKIVVLNMSIDDTDVTLTIDATGLATSANQTNGNQITKIQAGTETCTGTTTSVGDSATSVTLLAANTGRSGAIIRNLSTARLYIELGSTATTSSVIVLDQDQFYELPVLAAGKIYRGIITGIWASDAGGSASIIELV